MNFDLFEVSPQLFQWNRLYPFFRFGSVGEGFSSVSHEVKVATVHFGVWSSGCRFSSFSPG